MSLFGRRAADPMILEGQGMVRAYFIVAILVAVTAITAIFAWPRSAPEAPDAGAVVVRPAEPREVLPTPTPAPEPLASTPPRPVVETAILASMADPHAELRAVVVRRDAPQIACGEKRTARDPVFRRFVWLGHLKMLATDDGSDSFANIAAVCSEGAPVP
ncbi:hypothetical protein HZY97_13960 [Sphingomonas sp. R-74633]|uniref:hypothetical protein n=1 Tax=Sphingomonas sp. R-74633 TaxID=2751188 RepID=UPI0015D2AEB3|nr:hypothetical protein [Sphingomonas sp. R-74633]NYT41871.1 hypothetical protein [Sphingomonas sp. R-74633]